MAINRLLINDKMARNHMYKVEIRCTIRCVMAIAAITMEKNDIDKVTVKTALTGIVELNTY